MSSKKHSPLLGTLGFLNGLAVLATLVICILLLSSLALGQWGVNQGFLLVVLGGCLATRGITKLIRNLSIATTRTTTDES